MREAVSGISADRLCLHVYCMQWFVSTSTERVWLAFLSPPDVPSIGLPAFLKAVMKMTGMDLGPPRLPMLPISPDAYKRLESELKDIGFFDWS